MAVHKENALHMRLIMRPQLEPSETPNDAIQIANVHISQLVYILEVIGSEVFGPPPTKCRACTK